MLQTLREFFLSCGSIKLLTTDKPDYDGRTLIGSSATTLVVEVVKYR